MASAFGRTLKPTTIACRRRREHDVGLDDRADAGVDHAHGDLVALDLLHLADRRLDGALHVGLDDQVELPDAALLDRVEQVLERDRLLAARERLGAQPLGALLCLLARGALGVDDAGTLARDGRMVEAEDLDRAPPGRPPSDAPPFSSSIARTLPQASPATTASPACSVPRWTSIVATGPRPMSRRDSMMSPEASALGLAFSSSTSACSSSISSRLSRPVFSRAETSTKIVWPPHSSGCSPCVVELLADALGVRVRSVDLVDGDHDRHLGGLRVVDRLDRLRHHAVVGGDDEHDDVGDLGAAGAHGGERLVARGVEERDAPAVADGRLVGADVLRDAAGLGRDDGGLADRVEQRRLAVVDVAHDRDDRGARLEILGLVVEDLGGLDLVGGVLDRDLALELGADQLDGVVGERLRDGDQLAETHHRL